MEYYDSKKNPLRQGLYRDKKDHSHILYLFQKDNKWKFQDFDSLITPDFPLVMSKEIEPIDEPMAELERFRKIISFLERKINKEVEIRRDL